ncbi:MAG: 4-hydroxy-3-methylbut-2-enyl diphosphate reductase [Vicinamibacteria bacterium]|nr:4-hydroxy-3-methylbut-2-enyl diphosphate reductase [Vicinamibacteria bacterium]
MSQTYFQKGLGLKAQVAPILEAEYGSGVVDRLRELGYAARAGELTLRLAREFGFCYGVDRAVEYAYETRQKFPGKRLFLSGEIIHNPDVNARLAAMGYVQLDPAPTPAERYAPVTVEDVVLLPAFGVTQGELSHLRDKGCVLIDTTCGSVLNVWKNVKRYAQDGFTVVIHGKHYHEETRATASQALEFAGGQYLCVRNLPETDLVCAFIRGELPAATLLEKLGHAAGPGFEPDRDLQRIGLANQTTMLMSESLEVQERLRQAMKDRHGEAALASRFRAFDTICSATQDRQDAVLQLLAERAVDLMVVIGGYNSSNTQALAKMCADKVPTYHIDSAACVEAEAISHRAVVDGSIGSTSGWLPAGPLRVGLTAGASTPNSVVAAVVERVLAARGQSAAELVAL